MLAFEARAPRFEGAVTLASPPGQRAGGNEASPPWRVTSRVKADPSAARLDALEMSYGAEERALKLSGNGDMRFGASPLLRAALSARQLDADRFFARQQGQQRREPVRVLPALRALMSGIPQAPIPAQVELASEQVMLGGRPLQDIAAELHGDGKSWRVHRLDFRAPGTTRVLLSEADGKAGSPDQFKAALNVESSDPDALMTWLQGRGDITYRSQKPLRLRGDVTVAPDGFAIDAMKAEIDGGAVEGRVAVSHREANRGSKISAELKAESLDLDAATAFARSLAGPQAEWPDEGHLALDIGRAISAGQELRPLVARLGYGPKAFSLDQLNIGQPDKVALEGVGRFDRVASLGKLELNSTAASLAQLSALVAPFAPSLVARLNAMGASQGPARVKLTLALDKNAGQADRANARAVVDIDAPQLKGVTTITAKPLLAAIHGIDLQALGRSELGIRIEAVVKSGPRLAGAARARSHRRRRRGPGAIRGHGNRRMGCDRCGSRRRFRARGSTPTRKARPSPGRRKPRPVLP